MASLGRIDQDSTDNKSGVLYYSQMFNLPKDDDSKKFRKPFENISTLLLLRYAFQSLGVVYGDLGTSPLYVYYNTFPKGIDDTEDVIDALSLIIYSLTLIPLLKYVLIVCKANDNGQGGTFALYSLLCRHAEIRTVPNQDLSDEELTTYSRNTYDEKSFAAKTKRWLEKRRWRQYALFSLVLAGSCMVIGDGILTPPISVLSAVGGFRSNRHPDMSEKLVVLIAVAILIVLFSVQQLGIDRVSWLFAPILFIWFLLIGGIGLFNIWKYDSSVLRAFSPVHVYRFFKKGNSWPSLGGIILCITGTEALFADLSQFPVLSIQIAFAAVVFPSLLLAYIGQAAYLMQNTDKVYDLFYRSIPDTIYWPAVVVATAAAIVASQATISATFVLVKQAVALGCFPRVKIVYTSKKNEGHIYIPEVNWILMVLCVAIAAGFKNQYQIGNATGIAVIMVMLVTTFLMVLVMLLVWRCHWILVLFFTVLSLLAEGTYFSALVLKVNRGGWVPLVIAVSFFIIMSVWHYGTAKHCEFELHSKVPMAWIIGLGRSLGLVRVPGIGLVYTELPSGVPHIFSHFITNIPAIHSVVIFVCVKYLPVYTVPEGERFLVRRIGPKQFHLYHCVARYGYKDYHKKDDDFEQKLFESMFRFVRMESLMDDGGTDSELYSLCDNQSERQNEGATSSLVNTTTQVDPLMSSTPRHDDEDEEVDELEYLKNSMDVGVVHILGNTVVKARRDSELLKKIAIYLYTFLSKLCRGNNAVYNVPHECLLNVGQVVYV